MVGGEREIFDRVKPILESFGDKVFYAGAIGAGSICKLVHNMIGHSVRQAIAEGLTLGVKAGVEPEALWESVRRGSLGRMRVLHEGLVKTMFRGEYEPASFALNLAYKDISLATERLDWVPKVPLREGLSTTIEWFKSIEMSHYRPPTPNF